jgi:hypothetical protein
VVRPGRAAELDVRQEDRDMRYDAFVSHASEEKDSVARPLAARLANLGYSVWFDEFELKVGDSLRRQIDRGLAESRFGIVVLSPAFFEKAWTKYELDGLTAVEVDRGSVCILPVWHELAKADVLRFSPALAGKVAVLTTLGLEGVVRRLCESLGNPSETPVPLKRPVVEAEFNHVDSDKINAMLKHSLCPRCGQGGNIFGFDGPDGDEFDWFECPHCGLFHVLHSLGG